MKTVVAVNIFSHKNPGHSWSSEPPEKKTNKKTLNDSRISCGKVNVVLFYVLVFQLNFLTCVGFTAPGGEC